MNHPPITSSAPLSSHCRTPHLQSAIFTSTSHNHIHASIHTPQIFHFPHPTTPPPLPLSTVSYPSPPQTPLLRHPLTLTESRVYIITFPNPLPYPQHISKPSLAYLLPHHPIEHVSNLLLYTHIHRPPLRSPSPPPLLRSPPKTMGCAPSLPSRPLTSNTPPPPPTTSLTAFPRLPPLTPLTPLPRHQPPRPPHAPRPSRFHEHLSDDDNAPCFRAPGREAEGYWDRNVLLGGGMNLLD